jgi:hypothetical protein
MEHDFTSLGFKKKIYVLGRKSIANEFAPTRRCGIYILHFLNNEFYVGQAVNVASRFHQHRQNHSDIEYISFMVVPKKRLSQTERHIIDQLETLRTTLRNISLVSIIKGETDLDEVVSPQDQTLWMNDELPFESLETERFDYPEQRHRYTKRFEKFKETNFGPEIIQLLKEYILFTIPYPRKTEYVFWSLTCLPKKHIISRVNIFWQETLRIFDYTPYTNETVQSEDPIIAVVFFVSKSVLFQNKSKDSFLQRFKSISFPEIIYPTGGQDQQAISCFAYEFFDLLDDPDIFKAIKTFNLRLLRKGPCIFSRYHCFDLADEVLRTDNLA